MLKESKGNFAEINEEPDISEIIQVWKELYPIAKERPPLEDPGVKESVIAELENRKMGSPAGG